MDSEHIVNLGDCLELMRAMPDKSVDLVFTSPPSEDARTYGIGFKLKGQDWVDWSVARFLECLRISRGLVCWVVEGKTRQFRWSATPALLMADLHRAGVHLRKPPAFHRVGIPGSGGPDWWRNDWEFCVCGTSGGKLPWSDNTATGHPPKWAPGGEMSYRDSAGKRRNQWGHSGTGEHAERRADGSRGAARRPSHTFADKVALGAKVHTKHDTEAEMREQAYLPPVLANPGNAPKETYTAAEVAALLTEDSDFQKHIVGGGLMGSRLSHENEAPFPLSLADAFVRSFCPPGGTVLDPFCGSGTTAQAAILTGRRFIGIDVRDAQVELTRKRIAEAQSQLTTPAP